MNIRLGEKDICICTASLMAEVETGYRYSNGSNPTCVFFHFGAILTARVFNACVCRLISQSQAIHYIGCGTIWSACILVLFTVQCELGVYDYQVVCWNKYRKILINRCRLSEMLNTEDAKFSASLYYWWWRPLDSISIDLASLQRQSNK